LADNQLFSKISCSLSFLGKTFDGTRKLSNDGTTFGFTACFLLYPEQQFAVIILSNECGGNTTGSLYGMGERIYNENVYTATERASDGFGFSASINVLLAELGKRWFDEVVFAFEGCFFPADLRPAIRSNKNLYTSAHLIGNVSRSVIVAFPGLAQTH
jgi:hypothetical protein